MDAKGEAIVRNIWYSKSSVEEVKNFLKEFPLAINKKFLRRRRRLLRRGTLLHWSCIKGNDKIVEYLLSIGEIDLSIKFEGDGGGGGRYHEKTALEIAQIKKNEKIIQLLKEKMNPPTKPPTPSSNQPQYPTTPSFRSPTPTPVFPSPTPTKIPSNTPLPPTTFQYPPQQTPTPLNNPPTMTQSSTTSHQSLVESWFKKLILDEHEKDSYFKMFIKAGYDDLETITDLEKSDFDNIFNTIPPGHRSKIWRSIQSLKSPTPQNTQPAKNLQPSRLNRRRDPPTANIQPGANFIKLIPNAPNDKTSILNCLSLWSSKKPEDNDQLLLEEFNLKLSHFSQPQFNLSEGRSLSFALMWLYTKEAWPYKRINELLRADSPLIEYLAPFIKGLVNISKHLDPSFYFSGTVYRATNLSPTALGFYKPATRFIWSAFTSTTTTMDPSGQFGSILFVISIPKNLASYAFNVQAVSDFPNEEEILLPPNVGYVVDAVENPGGVYTTVIKLSACWVCVA
eukprot:TRINITY_DN5150_c0_g1_i4.p1 TRINITY_DN5150_c0_g1~~TRINITY_DN5150_c0_g1_i4.p1  ORF type:complete len:508 (-),score=151.27 TRINITY_DN5150_c0_g1_i4:73-1596(-)